MFEFFKTVKDMITFPYGIDKDYDDACDKSFMLFLDRLYQVTLTGLVLFGLCCIYFFVRYELLDV